MAHTFGTRNAFAERTLALPNWRWLCRLSLVEPAVAACWHVALARTLGLAVVASRVALLFASLWLVYTADRWLDVRGLPKTRHPRTERHRFVYENRRLVGMLWTAICAGALSIALATLERGEWLGSLGVAAAAVAYLLWIHTPRRTPLRLRDRGAKEFGVALLFTAGSTLFIWSSSPALSGGAPWLTFWASSGLYFVLALQNLSYLARREQHIDAHHDSPSGATRAFLPKLDIALGVLLLAVNAFVAIRALPSHTPPGQTWARVLPVSCGVSMGSVLLLVQDRLMPSLGDDARHLSADVAVLLAGLPAVLFPLLSVWA